MLQRCGDSLKILGILLGAVKTGSSVYAANEDIEPSRKKRVV